MARGQDERPIDCNNNEVEAEDTGSLCSTKPEVCAPQNDLRPQESALQKECWKETKKEVFPMKFFIKIQLESGKNSVKTILEKVL